MSPEEVVLEIHPSEIVCEAPMRATSDGGRDLAVESIAELAASIHRVGGVLQPVLVSQPDDNGRHTLYLGERRLRAVELLNRNGVEHGDWKVPARVCGPMTPMQVRRIQLAENTIREDLSDGQLAQGLILLRAAITAERLAEHGIDLAVDAMTLQDDDPIALWKRVDKHRNRSGLPLVTWEDVIADAGLGISPHKAHTVAAAFARLGKKISDDLDAHGISTAARSRVADWLPAFPGGWDESQAEIIEAATKSPRSSVWTGGADDPFGDEGSSPPQRAAAASVPAPPAAAPPAPSIPPAPAPFDRVEPQGGLDEEWGRPTSDVTPDFGKSVPSNQISLADLPSIGSSTVSGGTEFCPPDILDELEQAIRRVLAGGWHLSPADRDRFEGLFQSVLDMSTEKVA